MISNHRREQKCLLKGSPSQIFIYCGWRAKIMFICVFADMVQLCSSGPKLTISLIFLRTEIIGMCCRAGLVDSLKKKLYEAGLWLSDKVLTWHDLACSRSWYQSPALRNIHTDGKLFKAIVHRTVSLCAHRLVVWLGIELQVEGMFSTEV